VLNEKERQTREEGEKREKERKIDREKERGKHLLRCCETVLAGHNK